MQETVLVQRRYHGYLQESATCPFHTSQNSKFLTVMESSSRPAAAPSVGIRKRDGFFVSKKVVIFMSIFFVSAVMGTAVLTYYVAATPEATASSGDQGAPVSYSSNNQATLFASEKLRNEFHFQKTDSASKITESRKLKGDDIRLPTSVKPIRYVVRVDPLINGNFSIYGSVEILIEVLEATSNITLHIADIITKNETIKINHVDDLAGPGVTITEHLYDQPRDFYIANLGEELVAGQQYVFFMEYQGYLNDQLAGFYRSQYTSDDGRKTWLAVTQFEPTDARRAFPCFDEPALKAEFEVYIKRQTNMTCLSNMPLIETLPIEGDTESVWDHFNNSVPMSTYLVAFAVSDFAFLNSTYNDHVLFRVWAREGAIDQAEYAREAGPAILTWYEDYFKVPFPLPKQDMIALPDFPAGAMENWGLITYRETALLYDPLLSSSSNLMRVADVIAHELAHQWFGDLVTMEWWTDLWLNEGFATYVSYLGTDSYEPTWRKKDLFVLNDLQYVFEADCLETSHPISVPVTHPSEINQLFDTISYSKGASIIRMMNYFLTEPTFKEGLTDYLNTYKYANAAQDNLWDSLTKQGHADGTLPLFLTVKSIMDTWTLQMGYPVISVVVNEDGTAKISQERFLLVQNPNSTDTHDYKWWVPITFTSQENPDFSQTKPTEWISNSEDAIVINGMPAAGNWVIFNIKQSAYYRVNYDPSNWLLLINQLLSDHSVINIRNRAQVIDDALDLAQAGQLSYKISLSVGSYLGKETEYVPWAAALYNMEYLESMFTRTGGYGALREYLLDLLTPLYNSVGFDDDLSDPVLDQFKRTLALSWSCSLGLPDCVTNSVDLYAQWMANPQNSSLISPNLMSTVYCTGIAEGGEAEWDFAWGQYSTLNLASQKDTILMALGCSKEVWILSRYLEMAFTDGSGIRKQDSTRVFGAVARNDIGRDLAWEYLRSNVEHITTYLHSIKGLQRLIKFSSMKFNTRLKKRELIRFKEDNAAYLGTATLSVDQSIERTTNNINWMNNYYNVILGWLQDHGYGSAFPHMASRKQR